MEGIKHLIGCACILPHLRGTKDPIFHSFVVFSVIDDSDQVVEKIAQCNNCGVVHRVFDVCKSEIVKRESHGSIITEKDISLMLPSELNGILASYSCDIATWEHAHFIYSNSRWGDAVNLTREGEKGEYNGKRLIIAGSSQFRIEPYSYKEVM